MRELDGDRDMRSKLNLYKRTDTKAKKAEAGGMEVEGGAGEWWNYGFCIILTDMGLWFLEW